MSLTSILPYLFAAAIPLVALYIIRALDTLNTTRTTTLIYSVLWGGIGAFSLAYVVNNATLDLLLQTGTGDFSTVVRFTAPILEEILKAGFLIYLIRRPSFRYEVDGAIYGFCIGIGFAVLENFFYISRNENAGFALAISRSLSTSMMHAMASAVVGISLGKLRRSHGGWRMQLLPIAGILIAIGAHVVYNNVVSTNTLSPTLLLLIAIAFGLGGAGLIGLEIRTNVTDEKASFSETLSAERSGVDISMGEVLGIQRLGSQSFEERYAAIRQDIGDENAEQVRKLLITQANIGILKNNLASPNISPRLKSAWEREVETLEDEFQQIRRDVDRSVQLYMQRQFPTGDEGLLQWMQRELGESDPTRVHTFDMFMRQSGLATTLSPEQLEQLANKLQKIDIFREIDPADLENLARAVETRTYADGVMLFDQGDEGNAMFLIDSGAISIYSLDEQGREKPLRTFEAGRVVGDFAVLDGQPRSARARATGELHALVLTRYLFQTFIQSRPQVISALLKVLAEKARFTTTAVENSVRSAGQITEGQYAALTQMPALKTSTGTVIPIRAVTTDGSTHRSETARSTSSVLRRVAGQATLDLSATPTLGDADTRADGQVDERDTAPVRRTDEVKAAATHVKVTLSVAAAGDEQVEEENLTELTFSVTRSLERAFEQLAYTLQHEEQAAGLKEDTAS